MPRTIFKNTLDKFDKTHEYKKNLEKSNYKLPPPGAVSSRISAFSLSITISNEIWNNEKNWREN